MTKTKLVLIPLPRASSSLFDAKKINNLDKDNPIQPFSNPGGQDILDLNTDKLDYL